MLSWPLQLYWFKFGLFTVLCALLLPLRRVLISFDMFLTTSTVFCVKWPIKLRHHFASFNCLQVETSELPGCVNGEFDNSTSRASTVAMLWLARSQVKEMLKCNKKTSQLAMLQCITLYHVIHSAQLRFRHMHINFVLFIWKTAMEIRHQCQSY